jgi:hypothetical protein
MDSPRISQRFRVALAAKGLLLLALAATFTVIGGATAIDSARSWLLRLGCAALCGYVAGFLAWASSLAFADALRGQAVRESGATPLASRWGGWSLRAPSGRFIEYVLWNPWPALDPDASYTVTYGERSGVLVERPELEAR